MQFPHIIKEKVSAAVDLAWEDTLSHFADEALRVSTMVQFSEKHPPNPDSSAADEHVRVIDEKSALIDRVSNQARDIAILAT